MLRLARLFFLSTTVLVAITGCDRVILAEGGDGGGGAGGGTGVTTTDTCPTTTPTGTTDTWSTTGTVTGSTTGTDTWSTTGTDTWSTTGTDTWSTTGTDTWTTSGTDTGTTTTVVPCELAGGTCVPAVPDACLVGSWGDPSVYTCGGAGVQCCLPAVCQPGADQTCNQNLAMNSFAGHCNPDGTCVCLPGHVLQPSGKCL